MPRTRGTGLLMAWMDVDPAHEDAFNRWYNEKVEGQPKYLTVCAFANAGVPDTPEWTRARSSNPWSARMRPHVRLDEGSPAVFRRILPA